MDDELKQLERELRRLQPAAPRAALEARLERELADGARNGVRDRTLRPWLLALLLPAAAAVAFLIARSPETPNADAALAAAVPAPPAQAPRPLLEPVSVENVLTAARDEGYVTLDDGTPARRHRLEFVDTFTWHDPRTNASLTWTLPREEVRVVPISYQ